MLGHTPKPLLLCIEFSSSHRSVALVQGDTVLAEVTREQGFSTHPVELVAATLELAGRKPSDVNGILLGIGPGSYTGIRMAISVAQGWHLAHNIPVTPMGSFDAIEIPESVVNGYIAADAQRQQYAMAEIVNGRLSPDIRLEDQINIQEWIHSGTIVLGPDLAPGLQGAIPLFPNAARLGILATAYSSIAGRSVPPETIAPVYLRETSFVKAPPSRPLPDSILDRVRLGSVTEE
jgi:tRNA threonylcarbamoyladenosine biosynthesis protein TsaB